MADSLDQQRKQVAMEIQVLSRQVDEMDGKIRAYLADRHNKPHPRHLDLIEKIQGYRIDPGVASAKNLMTLLDNLQWKVHYSKRAWKQLWENAELQRQKDAAHPAPFSENAGPPVDDGRTPSPKAQYSVDTLWEVQQEKLRAYGLAEKETKSEFKKRMIQEYKQLNKEKKANQEIIMTFDKDTKHCKLEVK